MRERWTQKRCSGISEKRKYKSKYSIHSTKIETQPVLGGTEPHVVIFCSTLLVAQLYSYLESDSSC